MIQVVNTSNHATFVVKVNELVSEGYKVLSTSCGFANSEKYDFCDCYHAILEKEEIDETIELIHKIMTVEEASDTWVNNWVFEHKDIIRNVKITATPILGTWKPEWSPYVAFFYSVEYDLIVKKEM